MTLTPELKSKLSNLISSDSVVLFMKGTRSFPQCGFSASVVSILNTMVPKYTTVNILADAEVRNGLKEFSNWPTFPQLYVKGELVGGADIVRQMHDSGELQELLGEFAGPVTAPTLTITPSAAGALRAALADAAPGDIVHLAVDGKWEHTLDLGAKEPKAITVEAGGLTIQIDPMSAQRLAGVSIDFVDGPGGGGFQIDNPNRPPQVRLITGKDLQQQLATGTITELFDVRSPREREQATLAGSKLLDDAAMGYIAGLAKDTPIAFFCHHGGRSQNAAEHFVQQGFRKVYNLAGGIDAWSKDVDPKIPRY